MRSWMLVLTATLAACSGRTGAGPIGEPLELRQFLPDSLRSATASPADSTFHQEMPVGPDSARVEMTWTAFHHGSGRYLASVSARLVAPVRYERLILENISDLKNAGTKSGPIESAKVQIGWFSRGIFGRKSGVMNFGFGADGRRMIGPSEPR
jgi:hypothetical protein